MANDSATGSNVINNSHRDFRLTGELILNPVPAHRLLLGLVLLWCVLLLMLIFNTSYHRKTAASGWLAPVDGVKRVYNTFGTGVVDAIFVQDGELVSAGQPLFSLSHQRLISADTTAESEMLQQIEQQRDQVNERLTQLKQHHAEQIHALQRQQGHITQELLLLDAARQLLLEKINLAASKVQTQRQLREKAYISGEELLNTEIFLLQSKNEQLQIEQQQLRLQRDVTVITEQVAVIAAQHQQQLHALETQLSSYEQQLTQLRHTSNTTMFAPQSGIVFHLLLHKGDTITPQQYLFSIVTEEHQLKGYALVPSSQAANITKGSPTHLRYDALPIQEYGTQSAVIMQVSATPLLPGDNKEIPIPFTGPSYLVELALTPASHHQSNAFASLRPGMTFTADISTGVWQLTSALMAPFTQVRSQLSWQK